MAKTTKIKINVKNLKRKRPFKSIPKAQDDIKKPYIKPPRLVKTPPRYTVAQLMKTVSADRRQLVKNLAIKKLGTITLPISTKVIPNDTLTYRSQTYSKHNKHLHNVTIFCVDGNAFNEHSKVLVDCSCSDHVFRYEWNLARRGNAFMWRCNGEPPTVYTKLSICKHAYITLRFMLRQSNHGVLVRKSKVRPKMSFVRGV